MKQGWCSLAFALVATGAFGQGAGWSAADFKAETAKVASGQASLPLFESPQGKALLDQAYGPATLDRLRDDGRPLQERLREGAELVGAVGEFGDLYRAPMVKGRPVHAEMAAAGAMIVRTTAAMAAVTAKAGAALDGPATHERIEANRIKASAAYLSTWRGWARIAQNTDLAFSPADRVMLLQTLVDAAPVLVANMLPGDLAQLRSSLIVLKADNRDEARGRLLDALLARASD